MIQRSAVSAGVSADLLLKENTLWYNVLDLWAMKDVIQHLVPAAKCVHELIPATHEIRHGIFVADGGQRDSYTTRLFCGHLLELRQINVGQASILHCDVG